MATPHMQGQVIIEPLTAARETLWHLVGDMKAGGTLNPVTVVVPSSYAALSLRQDSGRSGMVNVRFIIMDRLAELLGAPGLSAQGRRPMTNLLEASAIRSVVGKSQGLLRANRNHPNTRRSLRNTFRQLRHASSVALDRLTEGASAPAETVRLYRRFRELTSEFYDTEDLANSAAESVAMGRTAGLDEMGPVIVYLVHDFSIGERRLVVELARNGSGCTVVLGLTMDAEADGPVHATAERFSMAFGTPKTSPATDPASESSRLLVAPNGRQEVRWAIRHMIKIADDEGVPFSRMAILYRSADAYGALVREEMWLAGVPVAGPDTTPLSQRSAGRTLLGLLRLSGSELSRDDVMAWLTSCPVRSPDGRVSATQWDLISRQAGIVRSLEQWRDRLGHYSDKMSKLASRSADLGEISESKIARLMSQSMESHTLREFIAKLAAAVEPPTDGSSWKKFSTWARGLMQVYFDRGVELPTAEADSEQWVTEILKNMNGADHLEAGPSLPVFVQTIEEALENTMGHLGDTGQGVFVGPLGTAVGLEFELVHVVGMVEGELPSKNRDDPLIPDLERRRAGGQDQGLPLQQARRAKERYDYLSALAIGSKRVLSYPSSDPIGGRTQYPSRWFLEAATNLEGTPVYTSTLGEMSERPWLSQIRSLESFLVTGSQETAADIHDYDVTGLWLWHRAGQSVTSHPLVVATHLARGLELDAGRRSFRLTPWNGDVSGAATRTQGINPTNGISHSPSSLERWARCPFSYLLGNELGLGALERPEDITTISAADKGLLIHRVIEQFFADVTAQGTFPQANQSWNAVHRETLHRVAEQAFSYAESSGTTGKAVLWDLERHEILSDLDSFLEADARRREDFGTATAHVESRFGMPDSGVERSWPNASILLADGELLQFHGLIDRVDITKSGDQALVIDYKTGSTAPYKNVAKDQIDQGRSLQLPVYALAVRSALGEQVSVSAAYWFISHRGKFKMVPPEPATLDEVLEGFESAVSTIVAGIRGGLFPANPGRPDRGSFENCRYCDFDSLCPSYRDVSWRRNQSDPRLSAYKELAQLNNVTAS